MKIRSAHSFARFIDSFEVQCSNRVHITNTSKRLDICIVKKKSIIKNKDDYYQS